jgi:hypothetical protein
MRQSMRFHEPMPIAIHDERQAHGRIRVSNGERHGNQATDMSESDVI